MIFPSDSHLDRIRFNSILHPMRYPLLCLCLFLAAAIPVVAGPWDRLFAGRGSRSANSSQWYEQREMGPYLLRSEFPLQDAHELVQDLEKLQDDIERVLEIKCQPQAIQIHLFNNKRNYDQYLRIRVPEGVNRQALYVPGTDAGRVYAYRHRDLDTDVRHETSHALLHTALPYVPIWIDEGLAEYFEVPSPLRLKGHVHRREIQNAIRYTNWKPRIERLEAKKKLMDMDGQDYRDAWGIVHFLIHGPDEAKEALARYFAEIRSGDVPIPISQQLRRRIADVDQAIIQHLMK